MPKVSIIIPVYNTEKYLRECLDSVVNQTLKDIEIICIDDGSTDKSAEILKEYTAKDSRIKAIYNDKNMGAPGSVRNIALEIATGSYVTFVDSDDYIDESLFENLYNAAYNNSVQIALTTDLCKVTENKAPNHILKDIPCGILNKIEDKAKIIVQTGSCCGKLYDRAFIEKYKLKFLDIKSIAEDNYFSQLAMLHANKIAVVNKGCYYYRKYENSFTSHERTSADFNIINVYKHIENYLCENISKKSTREKYLNIIRQREIKDFSWFINACKYECRLPFKELIVNNFPQLAEHFEPIIVSLTSYPARIKSVNKVIESILHQSLKADNVILWLAEEQFPNKEQDLPQQLLDLVPKGLTISWCKDIKSYKKLIPTLQKYPDKIIVTADDDNIYKQKWLEKLYVSHIKYPKDVLAHRVTKFKYKKGKFITISGGKEYYKDASYLNKLTGVGGVLYPPNCFYKDIMNEDLMMKLAPTNDDQWFWLQAALKGVKVRVVNNPDIKINYIMGTQDTALCKLNDKGKQLFWQDFNRLIAYYPKLKSLLVNEYRFYKFRQLFNVKNIFSIENIDVHKVVTILGLKLKIKSQKLKNRKFKEQMNVKIKTLNKKIKHQEQVIKNLKYYNIKYMHPSMYPEYLKDWYLKKTGQVLDLDNPQTFNEKIQWMKLYDSTPLKTRLADKYLVRDWVKEKIGEEYLIPLLGVWDNFDEIDFDELPNQFVLKCNHGCGYNIIVKNKSKLDIEDARKKINNWLNEDFAFRVGLELHYSPIPRKIIAEEYLENNNCDLFDYKFWCFNGKVKYIQFLSERNTNGLKMAFYDTEWNKQNFVYSYPLDTKTIEKPDNLEKMISLAEKLSEGFNHVRVDFYRLNNGKIYFGEMTFTSCSGMSKWEPKEQDLIFGQMIKLPEQKNLKTD